MIEINFIDYQKISRRETRRLIAIIFIICFLLIGFIFFFWKQNFSGMKHVDVSQNISPMKNVILPDVSEGDIKLLGIVIDDNCQWALISADHRPVLKIQQGDLVGKEIMRVEKIFPDSVEVFSEEFGKKILKINKDENNEKTIIN